MKFFRIAPLVIPLVFPVLAAQADDDDQPFAEEQQSAEFKQVQTKQEMGRVEPRAVIAPGPEAGPGASVALLQDRLRVLRENRSEAVRLKKPTTEIAALDAQISDLQMQLSPAGQ